MTQEQQREDGPDVHTSPEEGHPAGDGERTDRDIGGPTSPEDGDEAGGGEEGGHGTKPSEFEAHE